MDEASGQSLDPFEFHGHPASCIAGLGGAGPLPDPTYAFHTAYVPVARGHAHFLIRFANLQARRGSLVLRVHMLPDQPGAVAQMVTSHRVQLNWLAHHGGATELRFEAFRGARYALMGLVPDQLDAGADGLVVMLDRPATGQDVAADDGAGDAGTTAFRSDTVKPAALPLMLSLEPPSFAGPVSQPCTAAQLREPAFRARCRALGELPAGDAHRWQLAYPVQALERYGMLQPGARGLILGPVDPAVTRALAAAGTSCRHLALRAGANGEADAIDPDMLPGELFAFDFLLSIRAADALGDERRATAFVERGMECLRPGGLAVHVVAHREDRTQSIAAFPRNGLERLALALISRGHQVARVKPPLARYALQTTDDGAVPFGLIAQRATLIR